MIKPLKAFTLIELLVVVAIISLLASVVIGAVSTSRLKARDAAIKREVLEMRTLMAREMSDTGSYANLKSGGAWKAANGSCTVGTLGNVLKGTYASEVKSACDTLLRNTTSACGVNCLYFFNTNGDAPNKFTIEAYLPGASAIEGGQRYFCVGSSGNSSVHNYSSDPTFNSPGCHGDP